MSKKLLFAPMVSLILAIVLGTVSVVEADIFQAKTVAIKQDPVGGFTNADLHDTYRIRILGVDDFGTDNREANITYGEVTATTSLLVA